MSGVRIRNIGISDFRSIRRMDERIEPLTVLVGNNDSGKSNILRALNLFFNDCTDRSSPLDFNNDYNYFSNPNQRAKEIVVRVELILPYSYRENNGDIVVWEKKWRADANLTRNLHSSSYYGARLTTSTRGNEKRERVEISPYSNVHSLLSKIKFEYIPAVRDSAYFDALRARIYQTIAEVTEKSFRESSEDFQTSINTHLKSLIATIESHLGISTTFHLPSDLSPLFQKLDFKSGEQNVSLERRGDGVKVRHIPLMLDFIAKQLASLQVQGSMPYTFIWGYEEPENNLEVKAALALAEEFGEFVREDDYQIITTTHSPIFFNMANRMAEEEPDCASVHFVTRESDESGTRTSREPDDLDDEMGTMLLFAPYVADFELEIETLKEAKAAAEQESEDTRPKLVVEGDSDAIVFSRLIGALFPDFADSFQILTKPDGAGTNYVVDMVAAFAAFRRHDLTKPRALGIIDEDDAGRQARRDWDELKIQPALAKLKRLPKPPHLIAAGQRRYQVPVTLETLYDPAAWRYADERGWLKERDLASIASRIPNLNVLLNTDVTLEEEINADWSIYFTKEMAMDRKLQFARYWSHQADATIRDRFGYLEDWLEEVIDYLIEG